MRLRRSAAVLVLLALAASATPQETPKDAPPKEDAAARRREGHRVRGIVAFKRAAFELLPGAFDRVTRELESARNPRTGEADFRTYYLVALAHAAAGDASEGDQARREATKLDPGYAGYWLIDGVEHFHAERLNEAKGAFENLIAAADGLRGDPAIAAELLFLAHTYRARTLQNQHRHDEAIKALQAAIGISRETTGEPSTSAQIYMARSHVEVQEYARAEEILTEVLHREPSNARSYANLALVYYDQHRTDEAHKWYSEAIRRSPGLVEARERLAHIALRKDDADAARRHLEALEASLDGLWTARPDLRTPGSAANLHAGFGAYWRAVAERREADGDAEAARTARDEAERRFRRSLQEQPGCVKAMEALLSLLSDRDAPAAEIAKLKQELIDRQKQKREYRDTFC